MCKELIFGVLHNNLPMYLSLNRDKLEQESYRHPQKSTDQSVQKQKLPLKFLQGNLLAWEIPDTLDKTSTVLNNLLVPTIPNPW